MTNRRQNKINEVMGKIAAGLMVDQHINASPIHVSIGIQSGGDMISNCIVIHSAPKEIIYDLKYLEEKFPGVEVTFERGGARIDCEHVYVENEHRSIMGQLVRLLG